MRLYWFVLGISVVYIASGCASMISGTTQPVTFKSMPDGAKVSINGNPAGTTPTELVLKRKPGEVVEFYKEGYAPEVFTLDTRMNGWIFGNAIFCLACVLSTTTDYASGAAYEYSPNKYFLILAPAGVTESPSDTKKRKVKSFIIGNYDSIMSEISRMPDESKSSSSKGRRSKQANPTEYLNSLIALLEIPEPDKDEARFKIRSISIETTDGLKFSDDIVEEFLPD